jgi:two-component system response regulator FixJ
MARMLVGDGISVEEFATAEAFLKGYSERPIGCVFLDVRLPGLDGMQLLEQIADLAPSNPIIMVSGFGDIPSAVRAVRAGALDFLQKPFRKDQLLTAAEKAFETIETTRLIHADFDGLTPREREVLIGFNEGASNKIVAARLGLSPRTVEMHRARIFKKLGVTNLSQALLRARDVGLIG